MKTETDIQKLNKQENYLALDDPNNEYEFFETIEEAKKWLKEVIDDYDDGIPDDVVHDKIYKLQERIKLKPIAYREDYSEEEWEDEGYGDYEYIVEIQFEKVNKKCDDLCEWLNKGRDYLMTVNPSKITPEDALKAFGFDQTGHHSITQSFNH
jgi:hypothetical protein